MLKTFNTLRPKLVALLVAFSAIGFAVVGCDVMKETPEPTAVNISQLKFKGLDGQKFKIGRFSEKPMIVNVWATWCAPCIKELPSLMRLHEQGKYALLTVAIDGDPAVVKNFLQKENLGELPVVWDRGGAVIKEAVGLKGVPTTFIINANQEIVATEQGERAWDHPDMIAKIDEYLQKAVQSAGPAQPKATAKVWGSQ